MSARPAYLPSDRIRVALQQYADNGRWGTCAECPTQSLGRAGSILLPAMCVHTDRYDHHADIDAIARLIKIEREQIDGPMWKGAEVRVLIRRYAKVPVGSMGIIAEVRHGGEYVVTFRSDGMGYTFAAMDLRLME